MLWPSGSRFPPTIVTIIGQVNQALTGYGAVGVYGPHIFQLFGFEIRISEYLTLGNHIACFFLNTFAWLLIDRVGRRIMMVGGAFAISIYFMALTILGALAMNSNQLGIPNRAFANSWER